MGRRLSACIIFTTILVATPACADPAVDLHQAIARYEAFARMADPIRAASRGDAAAAVRWPDNSPEAIAARTQSLQALATQLAAIAPGALSEGDALERDVLARRIADGIESASFDEERMPFISGEGFFDDPNYAASLTVLRNRQEAEAWLARLDAIPDYYAREIVNMRRALRTRFSQPRLVVENALRGVRAQAEMPASDTLLLRPLALLPETMPQAERAAFKQRGEATYRARVAPAIAALADFLQQEYLPQARPRLGVRSLSNGARYYEFLVRQYTTTNLSPTEVHALGVAEVARVRGEMDAVIEEAGFQGSFAEFLAFLRRDPQFYPRDADDLMRISSEIANRINFELPRFFGQLPRNTYAVTFIASAMETGSAGYWPGNQATGVAGQVLLRRSGATQRSLYDLPAWILHEGAPGHHTQIALAEERADLPEYRRNDDVTAYVEGWALYAERLGEEMGVYRTPYERFGRLSMEMWRACRLVVDTGIHWFGWSRARAVACLRENSALSSGEIEREVDRYIGWPGQALAYKIGELEIRDLRAKAETALGACFDLRTFHDALLRDGALPMSALRARMEAWLGAQSCPAG